MGIRDMEQHPSRKTPLFYGRNIKGHDHLTSRSGLKTLLLYGSYQVASTYGKYKICGLCQVVPTWAHLEHLAGLLTVRVTIRSLFTGRPVRRFGIVRDSREMIASYLEDSSTFGRFIAYFVRKVCDAWYSFIYAGI